MMPVRNAGFAMLDVLVALLLLAIALTGAAAALVQAMRATHGALLTSRAVDLATDLTEELHEVNSVTQLESALTAWRMRVARVLPVAGLEAEQYAVLQAVQLADESSPGSGAAPDYALTLRWRETTSGSLRELYVPFVATAIAMAP